MPLITVKPATPLVPAGTYPADLISITPKSLVTQYSKVGPDGVPIAQDFLEWAWLVHGPEDIEVNSLTTLSTGPKSTMFKVLTALLGRAPVVDEGFDENDLIGKGILVATIVTDEGFAKIDAYIAVPKTQQAKITKTGPGTYTGTVDATTATAILAVPDAPADDTDDLPF